MSLINVEPELTGKVKITRANGTVEEYEVPLEFESKSALLNWINNHLGKGE